MSSSTDVADFTDVANWQGVDDKPTAGSDNPVKSGGVFNNLLNIGIESADDIAPSMTNTGGITMDGTVSGNTGYRYSEPISVAAGSILAVKTNGATSLASIAVKLDSNYYPHTACMGNNPSYQFYIAKVDTNIVITCNAEELSSLVVKKFKNEVVNEIAKNYSSIILNTLSILYTDSRILKWGDIPAIEGAFGFGATSFAFQPFTYGTHKVFPVNGGDKVYIDNNDGGRTYYGFVKTYTPPFFTHNLTIDYATGCSMVVVNSANPKQTVIVPDDAHYMIVCNTLNDRVWAPTALTINDYDVFTGVVKEVVNTKNKVKQIEWNVYLDWNLIPIKSGNIGNNSIENLNASPIVNGHRELPVKPSQLVKIYPCSLRVGIAVVKQINSDGTFVRATGFPDNIINAYADGPIEISVPFDGNFILITEYYTSGSTTYHWYAEDVLIDGESIVYNKKNDNLIWKSLFVENMLLGGAPITPVEFTYALPSGGDSLDDGSVCVGYYSGTTRYNEYSGDSHAGMTQFNMLNPILTQESYKALKDGDVVMWNSTSGNPDPEGESVRWRGMGIGSVGTIGNVCAKFVDSNTIRTLLEGGNCFCYVDFNRTTKTFETTEYEGQTINVGHMILLKIGNSYFKSDFTASYVETIESAISAIDSNFQRYDSSASLTADSNPVRLGNYYWASISVSNCGCLFKSADLKVFEFVRVIPAGYYSREVEFSQKGNYLYGIVRGWKNAFDNGGYSQLFKYDTVNDTFSDFVELTGLCGERPAFAIVDDKIYTINRIGNSKIGTTTIQRGNKLFQVYDLNFNLLNTVPLNFRRGCNTIQFIVHAKNLYAFVPTDARGFVVTKNAEGRNDLVWTYIDVRYLNK
jgi:hypothetical protein